MLAVVLLAFVVGMIYGFLLTKVKKKIETSTEPKPVRKNAYRIKIEDRGECWDDRRWRWSIEINYSFCKPDDWTRCGFIADGYDYGFSANEPDARIAGEDALRERLIRDAQRDYTYTYIPDL